MPRTSQPAPRLNKRTRKLAQALAAKRNLPPAEVAQFAAAQEACEHSRKQALAAAQKSANAAKSSPGNPRRRLVPRPRAR